MAALTEVEIQNRALARKINKETRADPTSSYTGKTVGLLDGEVAVVGDTLHNVALRLWALAPDRQRTFVFDASVDYDKVERV